MRVVLLARAYNDLDCRLPLIHEFMRRPSVTVSIEIIPTISSSGLTVRHPLAERMSITCDPLVERFLPRAVTRMLALASFLLEQSTNRVLRYKVWPLVWAWFYRYISESKPFRNGFLTLIDGSVTIIDDILATPDRSIVVPLILSSHTVRLLCLSHGQNTYLDLWHDKPKRISNSVGNSYSLRIYAPSENDRRILSAEYPGSEVITIGNTRFDNRWVLEFQESFMCAAKSLPAFRGTKIAFMMSKMEYGLDADAVVQLINLAATRSNTRVILKPHTRGMSLDEFDGKLDARVVIAETVSSSEIINWADVIFFTGSSIIFEAMVKKKKVLYLAALQSYKSVFDELPTIAIFRQGDDLNVALNRLEREEYDEQAMNKFLATYAHNGDKDGRVCAAFVDQVFSELEL